MQRGQLSNKLIQVFISLKNRSKADIGNFVHGQEFVERPLSNLLAGDFLAFGSQDTGFYGSRNHLKLFNRHGSLNARNRQAAKDLGAVEWLTSAIGFDNQDDMFFD